MTKDNFDDAKKGNNPVFMMQTQFLNDLSFECPNSSFGVAEKDLEIDIAISLETKALKENLYEIALKLKSEGKSEERTLFIADVSYAGRFIIENLPEEQKEMLIGIEAPQLLFPFARRILMNVIADAGFRSPIIEPINFAQLFMQAKQQKQSAPEEQKKINKD